MSSEANEVLLTEEGLERLKVELDRLKTEERMRIADAIREAKSHGDLRENAMYHEAKLNQKRLEGRIADLEKVVQIAKVVDRSKVAGDAAFLNSKVKVKDLEYGDELEFELVGSFEADPMYDMISITSPLGAALMGKQIGEEVEVEAPAGVQRYKILDIS